MIKILMYTPVLIASIILGKWFLAEASKSKQKGEAGYKPYVSIPGIIIVIIVLGLPVVIFFLKR